MPFMDLDTLFKKIVGTWNETKKVSQQWRKRQKEEKFVDICACRYNYMHSDVHDGFCTFQKLHYAWHPYAGRSD